MTDAQLLELKQGELDAVYETCTRITEERDAARAERDALRAALESIADGPCEPGCDTESGASCSCWWTVADRALAGRAEGE